MGVRILEDNEVGAVLYCSVTDWAFGPIFADRDEAQAFLDWLPSDPRSLSDGDLDDKFSEFRVYLADREQKEAEEESSS